METTAHTGQLSGLAEALDAASETGPGAAAALRRLREIAGAEAALVVSAADPTGASAPHRLVATDGTQLPVEDLAAITATGSSLATTAVPESWEIGRASCRGRV